jgi:hypothetical protein
MTTPATLIEVCSILLIRADDSLVATNERSALDLISRKVSRLVRSMLINHARERAAKAPHPFEDLGYFRR